MKRIAFVFAIVLFACLLSVGVSAVTGSSSDEFGEVTIVSGVNENTNIKDKTSRVVLLNEDKTYTTYPAYYVSDVNLQWQGTVQYNFDALNAKLKTKYSMNSIVRLEILTDSTIMNNNGGDFKNLKNLKEIVFPPNTQIKKIVGQQFKSSGLEKICIPATVQELGTHVFEDCQSLRDVTFEEGFSLTAIPQQMFTVCKSLEKITFPDSVESIGAGCFSQCISLKEIRFGKNFKTVGNQSFSLCRKDLIIYAPSTFLENLSEITTGLLSYDSGDLHQVTLFFEGTEAQAQALVNKSKHKGLSEANLVEWQGDDDSNYIPQNPTAWTIVYSYNMCSHKWSENEGASVTDFYSPISVGKICTKCQSVTVTKTISPIFDCLGSSFTETPDSNGKYYMTVGYIINNKAYQQYKKYGEIDFGFVVCFTNIVGNEPLTLSGDMVVPKNKSQVYISQGSQAEHNCYDIKIGGLSAKTNGAELLMCIYVVNGEKIYYLCENVQTNTAQGTILNIK